MYPSIYMLLIITSIILGVIIVFIARYKKNNYTELYREGVRNENDGHYLLALQNFEKALNENRKLKLDNKFGIKISQRIKVLRYFTLYENSFQIGRPPDIAHHLTYTMNK